MCGRYSVMTEEDILEMREILEEINRRYAGDSRLEAFHGGEIFPTNTVPVLAPSRESASGGTAPHAALMRWGFPRYQGSGVVINARSETVTEKPMFRSAFAVRRCVVPSTGFYEWRHEAGRATGERLLFRLPDTPMLYMAGLFGLFPDVSGSGPDRQASVFPGFVILTTQANASVSPVHDRMPLVLAGDELESWVGDPAAARALVSAPCRHLLAGVPA